MVLSAKQILFGSALLLAGTPLFANETAAKAGGVAPAPRAYVNCPGIANVPMTSDAEQALPMRQIATLSCGQPVAILADNEGYTTLIRTSDGNEGYVAHMYLTNATPAPQPVTIRDTPSTASPVDGIVRWNAGAPGCDQFTSRGRKVESATANGVTVQVSLQDTGWKLHASVAVSNASGSQIYVNPSLVTLDELMPTLRNLREENPSKLAHSAATHQLMHSEYVAGPPPSAIVLHSRAAAKLTAVSDRSPFVGDYLAPSDEISSVRAAALKAANLAPGQKTSGELWYTRAAKARELSLRLSVGDQVFDFPFSFE